MRLRLLALIIVTSLFGTVSALAGKYTFVDAEAAKELHERGVLFVDVRTVDEHAMSRIPGAIVIDVREDGFVDEFTSIVNKDQEVVFYCRGYSCSRSGDAIEIVLPLGYRKLFLFGAGLPGWQDAGYDVEK